MKTFIGVVLALLLLRVHGGKPNNGFCVQNSCFTVHANTVDFNSAQTSCERKQGSLLTVRTKEVSSVISDLLIGFSGHFWLGLIHEGNSCTDLTRDLRGYTWLAGDSSTRFKNWKNNEVVCSRRCVSVSEDDAKWTERRCNDTADIEGYICEYQNAKKCKRLTSDSSVLYETPFGFSRRDLSEVPDSSNATRLDLGTKHICLESEWLNAPWNCEVYKGGCEHQCVQKNNTYACTCPPGYKLESNAVSCEKARSDPCQEAGCQHSCKSKGNSYECLCHDGFALEVDGKTCKDINECVDKDLCPGQHLRCENTVGGFECNCVSGFKKDSDELCIDDDECESGPCDHVCYNTVGSYHCECWEGYNVSAEDRHKCALYCPHWECPAVDCDPNNPFQCNCPRGFILEERPTGLFCTDIDECEMLYCDEHCINTIGGYICSCGKTKCVTDVTEIMDTTVLMPTKKTPTETPLSVSTGGVVGITVCIVAVILLIVCLGSHRMKCCGKMDSFTSDKGLDDDVHGLQQVTTEKYNKKLTVRNITVEI